MKKLFIALLLIPCFARAEFFTGNELLRLQKSQNTMDLTQALGYVQGVFDAHMGINICPPAGVTAGQVQDMIRNYLENNPAIRNRTADLLIRDALKSVWPCQQRTPGRGA